MKRSVLADSLLVLCLASVLIWPLFRLEYLDNWPSIESTFIADARMLGSNLPHPGWQPLWYCGTRFDYIYPPALRYGTALIAKFGHISPARAYHLYTAFFYIFGIAAVYWMVRIGSVSRRAALLASGATALLSPSFLFLTLIRHDSGYWVPQRLHVLMAYGEGPHISALCILPAALAASFLALRRWRPAALGAAGALSALAVATNFYGATALAIFFPIMVWAVWVGERDWRVWLRAAAIAALAYGLSAFWLTPSYVKITLVNLQWVSQPGHTWSIVLALIVLALFCAIGFRLGNGKPDREWSIFVAGAAVFLSLDVLGFYYLGFRIAGEPPRLVTELDLALILVFVEGVRMAWKHPRWHMAVAVMVVVAFVPAIRYLRHVWSPFPKAAPLSRTYEYQITEWVHEHLPGQRVLPAGTVRFWFDAWSDNEQPDGGSMQGMLNQNLPGAFWNIEHGSQAESGVLWLRALGADAVIVPGANSPEHYHDYQQPEKFRGALPVLYDDQHDTVIYGIPRVHTGIGRVVDRKALGSVGRVRSGDDSETLNKYLAVVENPAQAATAVTWRGFDDVAIRAHTSADDAVLLQETYDPSWRAFEGSKELTIRPEPLMGFMLIDLPAGDHSIRMHFETPLENRVGQVLLALSTVTLLGLFIAGRPRCPVTA
jgi:hypothetical protein